MSLCWLCVNISNEYKNLYDENGHRNETYDITVKYFDPVIFNHEGQGHHLIVMCLECWRHISDFHIFREKVILAQTHLLQVDKEENAAKSEVAENDEFQYSAKSVSQCPASESLEPIIETNTVIKKPADVDKKETVKLEAPRNNNFLITGNVAGYITINQKGVLTMHSTVSPNRKQELTPKKSLSNLYDHPGRSQEFLTDANSLCSNTEGIVPSKNASADTFFDNDNESMDAFSLSELLAFDEKLRSQDRCGANTSDNTFKNISQDNFKNQPKRLKPDDGDQSTTYNNNNTPTSAPALTELSLLDEDLSSDVEFVSEVNNINNTRSLKSQCGNDECNSSQSMFMRRYHLVDPQNATPKNNILAPVDMKKPKISCKICGKIFSKRIILHVHMHVRHKANLSNDMIDANHNLKIKEITSTAGKIRTARQSDNFIAKGLPILNCEMCQEACSSYTLLRVHHFQQHPNDVFYIVCCKNKFYGRHSVEEHVKNAHFVNQRYFFKCEVCSQFLSSSHSLQRHILHKHNQTEVFNFKCGICNIDRPTFKMLQVHFRVKHPQQKCCITCCGSTYSGVKIQEHMTNHKSTT